MIHLKSKEQIVAERSGSVMEATKYGDTWKVKALVDVPKSLINAFVSKAKKENDIDPRETWGDEDLAQLFVNYVMATFVNIESLPVTAILGDKAKSTGEVSTDVQPQEMPDNGVAAGDAPLEQPIQPVQPAEIVPAQPGEPTSEIQN
jgi:hypothetical protein